MTKNIFLSSTFIDLQNHRESIWQLFDLYDIEITGMENFGARTQKPLETCLHEVEHCDVFLLIVGMRYGSIDLKTGKSFTELEYLKAISTQKDIYVYLIDEENSLVKPSHIDYSNLENLKEFKNLLLKNHTCDYFKNENELTKKVESKIEFISNKKNNKRPHSIEASIFRSQTCLDWIIIISHIKNKPYEIFICYFDEDIFFIPQNITKGYVFVRDDEHFDFRYIDKQGYKTTIEGLERTGPKLLSKVISKILQNNISFKKAINIIDDIEFDSTFYDEKTIKDVLKEVVDSFKKEINR